MTAPATTLGRGEFKNEPIEDFSKSENRKSMEEALKKVAGELGREYPILIGGEKVFAKEKTQSTNPSHPDQVIGIFQKGTVEMANQAVEAAHNKFAAWKNVPFDERAECCFRAAEILRKRRYEMDAWLCYETGKTWTESDADTAELIDFCEYYGREMLRLGSPQKLIPSAGEKNYLTYIPLGVGIVIPPWNFAAAIMGGMTMAAIVTGNTVVVKPSSDSPTVAAFFMEIMRRGGRAQWRREFFHRPREQRQEKPLSRIRTRASSPSPARKEVGLRIGEISAKKQPGQIWIKRTVLEMGGKDAIIVDDEADLDSAAEGVAQSAFGYQGQKCSACSRAIVAEKVYDKFIEKLIPRVKKMKVGRSENCDNYMGPVINKSAMKTILEYIEAGKKEGRLLAGGGQSGWRWLFHRANRHRRREAKRENRSGGNFRPCARRHSRKRFRRRVRNRQRHRIRFDWRRVYEESAKSSRAPPQEFHVGNLYLNRKCTGAKVGVHPFGGFNMSGTDSKAGGQDYLLLFLQAKVIAEKV